MTFQDRVALVTGASRGIGRSIALTLAERGAAVAVNYRSHEEDALSVVKEIEEAGGTAVAIGADVSDPEAARELVEEARRRLGGLHILVNNAGITSDGLIYNMAPDAWSEVMRVNFGGGMTNRRHEGTFVPPNKITVNEWLDRWLILRLQFAVAAGREPVSESAA